MEKNQMMMIKNILLADLEKIKRIGFIQAFKAITLGLIIAYIIMGLMAGPLWIFSFSYAVNIIAGAIVMYIAGYLIGGKCSFLIFKNRKFYSVIGIISGFLIVWITTFLTSLISFIKEGLVRHDNILESIHDYIYKPFILVTIFGCLPITIVGVWFGTSIEKKVNLLH